MKTIKLRPGYLISLKTTLRGGVHYARQTLSEDETTAHWETTRTIEDPEEHDAAVRARGKANSLVRGACQITGFGLLCPLDREASLTAAITEARAVCDAHNASATATHIDLYIFKGLVSTSDEEASRAVAGEIAELLAAIDQGIGDLDPKAIRDSIKKAQELAEMLDAEEEGAAIDAVQGAIAEARKAARDIVRRVGKKAEDAAVVLADISRTDIRAARMAFTWIEADAEAVDVTPAAQASPAVALQRFADLVEEVV